MTTMIRMMFAAADGKRETVEKIRQVVFTILKNAFSKHGDGNLSVSSISSNHGIDAKGDEKIVLNVGSRHSYSNRFVYQISVANGASAIDTSDVDVVVLFVSADFLLTRQQYSWSVYLQSFLMRVPPHSLSDGRRMQDLSMLFEEMRQSGGNYRLQNRVWVVVIDAHDCVRENEWAEMKHSTNITRTLFLRDKDSDATKIKYLWNHIGSAAAIF